MATGGEAKTDDVALPGPDLECPVCMQLFEDPKVLHCGHSICESCVRKTTQTSHAHSTVQCPVCRTVCPVDGALPTNYALLGVIDEHRTRKESVKCKQCGKRAKIADVWLCRTCDNMTICANCAVKSHREEEHKLEAGEMVVKRQREEISAWKQQFAEQVASLDEKKDEITVGMTRFEQKLEEVTELVLLHAFKTHLLNEINAFKLKLDSLGVGDGRGSLDLSSFSAELQESEEELLKWNKAQNQFLSLMESVCSTVELMQRTKAELSQFAESLGLQMDEGGFISPPGFPPNPIAGECEASEVWRRWVIFE